MDRMTRMHRIWDTIRDIPRGNVASYGQIAEISGIPRGARQVGYALHALDAEDAVPWHRVINARGQVSRRSFPGCDHGQRDRLEAEGITLLNGRVSLKHFGWQPDVG